MPIKQTHIYRGHAIVHQVFATDLSDDKIEQFIVSQPGKHKNLCTMDSLDEAKAAVDERLATPTATTAPAARRYALNPV
ncbi:MAG TPA: hypothetical protein VGG44_10275 [Tepidisphaeraceae bacterium]|jgi:hypothetical protein